MVNRCFDLIKVAQATVSGQELFGFRPDLWISDERNIALEDENDNLSLLEYNAPGIYTGHYFFKSRGRGAVDAVNAMLETAFNDYPVEIIRGLTPVDNLGAKWLTRHVGFTSYGEEESPYGDVEVFILTKHEFEGRK